MSKLLFLIFNFCINAVFAVNASGDEFIDFQFTIKNLSAKGYEERYGRYSKDIVPSLGSPKRYKIIVEPRYKTTKIIKYDGVIGSIHIGGGYRGFNHVALIPQNPNDYEISINSKIFEKFRELSLEKPGAWTLIRQQELFEGAYNYYRREIFLEIIKILMDNKELSQEILNELAELGVIPNDYKELIISTL